MEKEEYINREYGNLTIIGTDRDSAKRLLFICRCGCGNVKKVQYHHVLSGRVKSCGCKHSEYSSKGATKHGEAGTRLYRIWRGMVGRCYYECHTSYPNYGGRGISVCEEWRSTYEPFRDWALSHGYADNLTIDRIDVNGNYEPDNCRWITNAEQQLNKRPRKRLTWEIDGVVKSRIEWCELHGKNIQTVMYRVNVKGMTPKMALEM